MVGSLDLDGGRRGWLTRLGDAGRPLKRTSEGETLGEGTNWGEGGYPGLGDGQ